MSLCLRSSVGPILLCPTLGPLDGTLPQPAALGSLGSVHLRFKASGIGREYGPEGLDEFVEFQAISLLP